MAETLPPESGFRVEVERPAIDDGPPWRYRGRARTPSAAYSVAAVLAGNGSVQIDLASDVPARLGSRVRAMIRAACAEFRESPPPLRIVKWHGER